MTAIAELTPRDWLISLFEYEYCAECHGDVDEHEVVLVMGNYFARCIDADHEDTCRLDPGLCEWTEEDKEWQREERQE